MNFLAHMLLSGYDDDIIAGNFAADFLRTSHLHVLPEANFREFFPAISSYVNVMPLQ